MGEKDDEALALLELPRWMRSPIGQWFARHWAPAGALWRAEMDRSLMQQAEFLESVRRDSLLVELNRWAAENFALSDERRAQLIGAWCSWRNAAEQLHTRRETLCGVRLDQPLQLVGMPMLRDDPQFLEVIGGPKGGG